MSRDTTLSAALPTSVSAGQRLGAGAEKAGLAKAAREFESLFAMKLVDPLVEATGAGGGTGGGMVDLMMSQSLAGHLSKGTGLGVAGFLYKQWTGEKLPSTSSLARVQAGAGATPSGTLAPSGQGPDGAPFGLSPGDGGEPRADDGVTPLRELLPPTGLEGDYSKSQAKPESPAQVAATGENRLNPLHFRAGKTDYSGVEATPSTTGSERVGESSNWTPDRSGVSHGYQANPAGIRTASLDVAAEQVFERRLGDSLYRRGVPGRSTPLGVG
jgi:hypothetical protein